MGSKMGASALGLTANSKHRALPADGPLRIPDELSSPSSNSRRLAERPTDAWRRGTYRRACLLIEAVRVYMARCGDQIGWLRGQGPVIERARREQTAGPGPDSSWVLERRYGWTSKSS